MLGGMLLPQYSAWMKWMFLITFEFKCSSTFLILTSFKFWFFLGSDLMKNSPILDIQKYKSIIKISVSLANTVTSFPRSATSGAASTTTFTFNHSMSVSQVSSQTLNQLFLVLFVLEKFLSRMINICLLSPILLHMSEISGFLLHAHDPSLFSTCSHRTRQCCRHTSGS